MKVSAKAFKKRGGKAGKKSKEKKGKKTSTKSAVKILSVSRVQDDFPDEEEDKFGEGNLADINDDNSTSAAQVCGVCVNLLYVVSVH